MPVGADAACRSFEFLKRARGNLAGNDKLEAATQPLAFDPGSAQKCFSSLTSICLADERVQLRCRVSAIDAFASEASRTSEIAGHACKMERGCRIHDHEIECHRKVSFLFAAQDCADQLRVLNRSDRLDFSEGLPFQSEILRRNRKRFDSAVNRGRGDKGPVRDRYFIQTVTAMDYPSFLHTEASKGRCHRLRHRAMRGPQNLKRRPGRIG